MMPKPRRKADQKKAKTVLRLPDLEFAKAAVLDIRLAVTTFVSVLLKRFPLSHRLTGQNSKIGIMSG